LNVITKNIKVTVEISYIYSILIIKKIRGQIYG